MSCGHQPSNCETQNNIMPFTIQQYTLLPLANKQNLILTDRSLVSLMLQHVIARHWANIAQNLDMIISSLKTLSVGLYQVSSKVNVEFKDRSSSSNLN